MILTEIKWGAWQKHVVAVHKGDCSHRTLYSLLSPRDPLLHLQTLASPLMTRRRGDLSLIYDSFLDLVERGPISGLQRLFRSSLFSFSANKSTGEIR